MTILVAGVTNVETTLQIERFPLEWNSVNYPFFGINSTVSGVGFNLSKALKTLGSSVKILTPLGNDRAKEIIVTELNSLNIENCLFKPTLGSTPQSIVIFDNEGKRQIHTDLKDIQELKLNEEGQISALNDCSLLMACNVNFVRPLLSKAKERGILIATDVHAIESVDDEYNKQFLASADILFLSNAHFEGKEDGFVNQILEKYSPQVIVIGMGERGALLYDDQEKLLKKYPIVKTRPVVNTIGAGDALFACFIHFYHKSKNASDALEKALLFASYKIGASSGAEGFLSEKELLNLNN